MKPRAIALLVSLAALLAFSVARGASSSGRLASLAGFSGKIRALLLLPGDAAKLSGGRAGLEEPGVYPLAAPEGVPGRLSLFVLVPFSEEVGGAIGNYRMGTWPSPLAENPAYAVPAGFIKITKEEAHTPVSEHFRAGDFLTKDQFNIWPKYLVLDPRLLDKLELTIAQLSAMGHPVKSLFVMSGFRTPRYNSLDVGPRDRSSFSRHMYGDAADVYPDDDHDGRMDDLNHDGRVNEEDARIVFQAAEEVERKFPALVGGAAIYRATPAHGPFVHIDCRGKRARWGVGYGD
jgi:hypothetical protein